DVDQEPALRIRGGSTGDAAMQSLEGDSATTAGKPDAVRHLCDRADLRVLVVVLGHEQYAILVADVDGEGDVHVGEDDDVFQGDEKKACGVLGLAHDARFRTIAIVGSETVPTRARPAPGRFSSLDSTQTLQGERGDPPCETVRGRRNPPRAPGHDACDEDATLPEDEPRVVPRG